MLVFQHWVTEFKYFSYTCVSFFLNSPLSLPLLATLTTQWSFPDESVSHGEGVRQGSTARTTTWTQKVPTSETTGWDTSSNTRVNLAPEIATNWHNWLYQYTYWPLAGMAAPCPSNVKRLYELFRTWMPSVPFTLETWFFLSHLQPFYHQFLRGCIFLYKTLLDWKDGDVNPNPSHTRSCSRMNENK